MAANDVLLNIQLQFQKTLNDLNRFSDQANSKLDKLGQSLVLPNIAAGLELATKGFELLSSTIGEAIDEASQAQQVFTELQAALLLSGDATDSTLKSLEDFAKTMQKTTTFSDEQILSQITLAKNMGRTTEQAKKITSAAVDLAAATGISLDSAVRQLSLTYDGQLGRLNRVVPATKSLTESQLKAGEAVDIVAKKLGGFSQLISNTYSGALQKARNQFGEVLEQLGGAIVDNPIVIELINTMAEAFSSLASIIEKNKKVMKEFLKEGILTVLEGILLMLDTLPYLEAAWKAVMIPFNLITNQMKTFYNLAVTISKGQFRKMWDDIKEGLSGAKDVILSPMNALKESDFMKGARLSLEKYRAELEATTTETEILKKETVATVETMTGKFLRLFSVYLSNPVNQVSLGTSLIRGRAGATDLLTKGAGAGIAALTGNPELAGPIGELLSELAKGPENTREMIKQFMDAVPDVITAIIESLPEVIPAIIEKIPDMLGKIIQSLPRIMVAMGKMMLGVVAQLFTEGGKKFLEQIWNGAKEFVNKLVEGAGEFLQRLGDGLAKILDSLNPFTTKEGSRGGIGNAIFGDPRGGNNGLFNDSIPLIGWLAKGGTIPGGFPNDTYRAQVTSGEMVIPRDDVTRLKKFLDNNTGTGAGTVVLKVGEKELASVMLNLNRRGFRTA